MHLGVCAWPLPLSRRPLAFCAGICTSGKDCEAQARCHETKEAAEKSNLASDICSADKRQGSTGSTRHPGPVIFDEAWHVCVRVPVSAPLCALAQHLTPSSPDKWYIHAAFAINTKGGREARGEPKKSKQAEEEDEYGESRRKKHLLTRWHESNMMSNRKKTSNLSI